MEDEDCLWMYMFKELCVCVWGGGGGVCVDEGLYIGIDHITICKCQILCTSLASCIPSPHHAAFATEKLTRTGNQPRYTHTF